MFLALPLAAAAPVTLSTAVEAGVAQIATLEAERCVPVMEGVFTDLRSLTPAQVDARDVAEHGPAMIEALWAARQRTQAHLTRFHADGSLTEACVDAVRRADLATRYLVDHLYEAHPSTDPWLTTAALPGLDALRSGDVLITRGAAITSAGIAHIGAVDSQFSHNALVYIDPDGARWTVEAYLERGAIVQPLEAFLDHGLGRIAVMRHPDAALAARAAEQAYTRVAQGAPIPYDEAFRSDDGGEELFCSEIGPWAFALAGGPTDMPLHPTRFPHDRTPQLFEAMGVTTDVIAAPVDLLFDPRLSLVGEWRDVPNLETLRRQDAVVESVFGWMERDGYVLDPRWVDRATVDVGLAMRRTPVLGGALDHLVHPDGDRQFLVAGLALQGAGELLSADLDRAIGDRSMSWDGLKGELEALRRHDQGVWLQRPRRARFHRILHPRRDATP